SRECLIGARVIVVPLKDHLVVGIQDFATPLRISAYCGGLPGPISDDDFLAVFPEQLSCHPQFSAVCKSEHGSEREFVITLHDIGDPAFLSHDRLWWANPLELDET